MAKDYISVQEAIDKGQGQVDLRGWVYRIRNSNKFVFMNWRNHYTLLPVNHSFLPFNPEVL